MRKRLLILGAVMLLLVAGAGVAYWGMGQYRLRVKNIVAVEGQKHGYYVYPNSSLDSVLALIEADYKILSPYFFKQHFQELKTVQAGYYQFDSVMGDQLLRRRLLFGEQTAINVSFNRIRTRQQLAKRLSDQLLLDSLSIIERLESNEYMGQYGLKKETAVCLFLPDTYQMYWTITADQLFERMAKEYRHFWNEKRLEKAREIGLTPVEVAIIASIAEEETNKDFEYPIIAGLYINRLHKGMPLQACPTIKFALQDFTLRRILNRHLEVESPYNTYKNVGLPPGPIRAPRATTLDAVLNYTKSNYLYMCASAEFNGTHHFSTNYAEHARYARLYQAELNRRKIR